MCALSLADDTPKPPSLAELDLLGEAEADFDAITTLAAELFEVPVSLISIIDEDRNRQYFKSQTGLDEPWASARETPLSHSFCQHVTKQAQPLVVEDSREHQMVRDNPAITDLGVAAYLGVPVYAPNNQAVGALCVINDQPREWSNKEVGLLEKLGRCVSNEIRLKASALASETLFRDLAKKHLATSRYNALREALCTAFMAPDLAMSDRFKALLKSGCDALGMERGVITKVEYDALQVLFSHNTPEEKRAKSHTVGGTLSSFLISGKSEFHFNDVAASNAVGWRDYQGGAPGSFAGVPLILDGAVFGTLELSSTKPRAGAFSIEDLSILSMLSMLCSVHLGFVEKMKALQRSENALLTHMLDSKDKSLAAAS